MNSETDARKGIVSVDGVEYYKSKFVVEEFRKAWNEEAKRVELKDFDKDLRTSCSDAYTLVKSVVNEVPRHCPALIKADYLFSRVALCFVCAFRVKEAYQKLVNLPVKYGF